MSAPDEPRIEADPDVVGDINNDNDSAADAESFRGSTASISSSIYEYRTIHGRTYQSSKTTEYWAPNDEQHLQGFDLVHEYMLLLLDNKLYAAPIENPQTILDLGTGTGIWAVDMADEFPSAEVIGTDISHVQPDIVPPNCSFQIDDAQLEWTFKENYFDYIHIRHLYGGIDDWGKLYQQAFRHCKPGGWFEDIEIDIETLSENPKVQNDPDHLYKKWCKLFWDAGDKVGRTFQIARDGQMEKLMREAGFVDVVHKSFKLPIGGWAKDPILKQVGMYNWHFLDQGLKGFAVYPIGQIMGWSLEEITVLVAHMKNLVRDPKNLSYYTCHVVYGRKPEAHEIVPPSAAAPAPEASSSPLAGPSSPAA